jgi:hypothetical protein
MPESVIHAALVQAVVAFAERELGALADIAVREDAVRPLRGERPPRIAGYVPDVYATDVPTKTTLIGEAKTKADLEREHSRRQITAFLRYLAQTSGGILVISVPLVAAVTARRLLTELKTPFASAATRTIVLNGAQVWEG